MVVVIVVDNEYIYKQVLTRALFQATRLFIFP